MAWVPEWVQAEWVQEKWVQAEWVQEKCLDVAPFQDDQTHGLVLRAALGAETRLAVEVEQVRAELRHLLTRLATDRTALEQMAVDQMPVDQMPVDQMPTIRFTMVVEILATRQLTHLVTMEAIVEVKGVKQLRFQLDGVRQLDHDLGPTISFVDCIPKST